MKDFNIAKYLRENHLGSHAILGAYVDLHGLKEEQEMELDTEIPYEGPEHKLDGFGDEFVQDSPVEEAEGGSFNVSLMYADYPSITDAEQRLAIIHLKKLVKSLGGVATVTNDDFDTVDFNVTGISSFEELESAYNDVVENEDDDYTMLPSWDLEPKQASSDSMDTDDSVNPFPSIMKEKDSITADPKWQYDDEDGERYDGEVDKYNRMMGLAHEYFEKVSPIVRKTIDSLRNDGFDDQDIIDFLSTDWNQ